MISFVDFDFCFCFCMKEKDLVFRFWY